MDKSWIKRPRSSLRQLHKRGAGSDCFLQNDAAREFFSLMDESDRPLYQGNVDVLELLRDAFPDADIPSSFYEAKKIINRLGLNYQKIDACPNDCMLYWGEDDRRETCKKCHTSRFKTASEREEARRRNCEDSKVLSFKTSPAKIVYVV
ncbi:hypothetical protein K1719_046073 [Acacia pycnantha]|nr:hypothetical protein K1719_046073 [Acacia pycnantha]